MRWLPIVLALCACTPDEPSSPSKRTGPDPNGAPTDTYPVFFDRVPKNLLFISIDTFRRDHMRRYGNLKELTPFLDELAATGVALDQHTQCSNWTFHSTTCTLLGRSNIDNGFIPRLAKNTREPVPAGTRFLSNYLSDAEFESILISPNGWLSQEWGNAQGYSVFSSPPGTGTQAVYGDGVSRLERAIDNGADRWFLHLHVLEPHAAYTPPAEYIPDGLPPVGVDLTDRDEHYGMRDEFDTLDPATQINLERHLRGLYEGELRWLDDQLRGAFEDLAGRGLLDDTLVVVWTDHGEQFWEHGRNTHAYDLYREENDGVAFFWAPNIQAGAWNGPTMATDLVPTLLQLFDLPIPDEVTGIPVGEAPDDRARHAFAVARHGAVQSVQKDDWKLMFWWSGRAELYDLSTDPREQNDLYDPAHPKVPELWDLLRPEATRADLLVDEFPLVWPEGSQP
ncbi:MAG: arylsulfatase A-like enzyme [Myxococcota bacterium]|jgi:arylsulfatase A-like enzyme